MAHPGSITVDMSADLEEVRHAFKRLERHASKMAREMGFIEDTLAKYGISFTFAVTAEHAAAPSTINEPGTPDERTP
jgi:hypothetical protein